MKPITDTFCYSLEKNCLRRHSNTGICLLTHFSQLFDFYTSEDVKKGLVFWDFHGSIEMEHWAKMCQYD